MTKPKKNYAEMSDLELIETLRTQDFSGVPELICYLSGLISGRLMKRATQEPVAEVDVTDLRGICWLVDFTTLPNGTKLYCG